MSWGLVLIRVEEASFGRKIIPRRGEKLRFKGYNVALELQLPWAQAKDRTAAPGGFAGLQQSLAASADGPACIVLVPGPLAHLSGLCSALALHWEIFSPALQAGECLGEKVIYSPRGFTQLGERRQP